MTDPTSPPPEPPSKPPAPRRIPRDEATPSNDGNPDTRRVGQRVMEQRPHERKPTENAAARGKRPDLRDLPPPRRDTPSNVWRADPPPPAYDRRDGPRRAHGDAPRVDRPGERRAADAPRQDFRDSRPPEPDDRRPPPRRDDRRATGDAPRADRRRDGNQYPQRRDDRGPQGQGNERGAPFDDRPRQWGDRDRAPAYPQGPNERPRFPGQERGPRDTRDPRDRPPAFRDDRRPPAPDDRPPPRRREHDERSAEPRTAPPQRPAFDPDAPKRDDQRLSKVLAERGVASRREADDWIAAGWVKVDGEVAVLGTRVFPHQVVEVDEAAKTQQAHRVTILLHKPIGYVSGQAEDGYEPASVLVTEANHWPEDPSRERWHPGHGRGIAPAGRLDIDSTGMLVLTQDGRIARHLIGDDSDVEKEYLVRVEYPRGGQFPDDDLQLLRHGIWLDGKELRPAKVSWANEDQLRFVLREGRKRQIRRMCEAVGLVVTGLKRVRIGSVVLGKLPQGQWRYLREDERF